MDIESKLKRFSDVVTKEAEAHKDSLLKELDEKYNSTVADFEKKAIHKYADMDETFAANAEKLKVKKLTEANAEIKKTLIQNRGQYIDKIFENVTKKLDGFFKTAEYEKIIVDFIESYKAEASDKDELKAFIMKRDAKFQASIAEKTGVPVELVEDDFLGGVKISLSKNKVADCSFKHKFEQEKATFNKIRIV